MNRQESIHRGRRGADQQTDAVFGREAPQENDDGQEAGARRLYPSEIDAYFADTPPVDGAELHQESIGVRAVDRIGLTLKVEPFAGPRDGENPRIARGPGEHAPQPGPQHRAA
jgi:hypothetical protein